MKASEYRERHKEILENEPTETALNGLATQFCAELGVKPGNTVRFSGEDKNVTKFTSTVRGDILIHMEGHTFPEPASPEHLEYMWGIE